MAATVESPRQFAELDGGPGEIVGLRVELEDPQPTLRRKLEGGLVGSSPTLSAGSPL